jgi:hypothetical protein
MATPLRNVRVPDPLWSAALARAELDGRRLSDVIREHLQRYVDSDREVVDDAADEAPSIP